MKQIIYKIIARSSSIEAAFKCSIAVEKEYVKQG